MRWYKPPTWELKQHMLWWGTKPSSLWGYKWSVCVYVYIHICTPTTTNSIIFKFSPVYVGEASDTTYQSYWYNGRNMTVWNQQHTDKIEYITKDIIFSWILWQKPRENHHILIQSGYLSGTGIPSGFWWSVRLCSFVHHQNDLSRI